MTETAVINYFSTPSAAQRYARGRPSLHALALARAREWFAADAPFPQALDVACGTGHSTVALLPYALRIVGVDASAAMISEAPRHPAIEYREAPAERLPLADGTCGLVAIASAFHWVDHDRFLAEAARVLTPRGWLLIYKGGGNGKLPDRPELAAWLDDTFHARFPRVARHDSTATEGEAAAHGFTIVTAEEFPHEREQTLEAYVESLTTRSHVIRAVDAEGASLDEVKTWIRDGLRPFFPENGRATFVHHGRFQLLRRN